MRPSAELRARVLAAARSELSPTRAEARGRELLALVLGLAAPGAIFWRFGALRLAPRPHSLVVLTASGALAVAAIAFWLGVARGRSSLGRARSWLGLTVLLTPLSLFAVKVVASAEVDGMLRRWPERPGLRCLGLSCACLAVPVWSFFWARRRTVTADATLRGAAAGTALGAAVWVLVDLNCPVAYFPHLLLGHGLPLALAALVGAALGVPVLSLRGR